MFFFVPVKGVLWKRIHSITFIKPVKLTDMDYHDPILFPVIPSNLDLKRW